MTVTVWREQVEAVENLKKGDAVFAQGALIDKSWTDDGGNKRRQKKGEPSLVALARNTTSGEGNSTCTPARAQPRRERAAIAAAPAGRTGGLDIDQGVDDFPADEQDLPF